MLVYLQTTKYVLLYSIHIDIIRRGNMNVKGTVFITGKTTIIENFGEERWNSFMAKLATKDNYFSKVIFRICCSPPRCSRTK